MFVAICLFFFAFSTILSWNLFGKINVVYLFGKKGAVVYSILALGFIFLGTVTGSDFVWELTRYVQQPDGYPQRHCPLRPDRSGGQDHSRCGCEKVTRVCPSPGGRPDWSGRPFCPLPQRRDMI